MTNWKENPHFHCQHSMGQLGPLKVVGISVVPEELSSRSARSRCLAFRGQRRLTRFSLHEPGRTNRLTNPTLLVCICSSFVKYFQSTPSHRDSTPTPEMSCLHTVFPSSDTSRRFIMHPATNCPFPLDILPFVVLLRTYKRGPTFDQCVVDVVLLNLNQTRELRMEHDSQSSLTELFVDILLIHFEHRRTHVAQTPISIFFSLIHHTCRSCCPHKSPSRNGVW